MKAPVLFICLITAKPFLLEMDASKDGLGGSPLLQKGTNGKYHPIAYGSKALTKSERETTTHPSWNFLH